MLGGAEDQAPRIGRLRRSTLIPICIAGSLRIGNGATHGHRFGSLPTDGTRAFAIVERAGCDLRALDVNSSTMSWSSALSVPDEQQ